MKWIDAKKEQPDTFRWVLVCLGKNAGIGYYLTGINIWHMYPHRNFKLKQPAYWMDILELPKSAE